MLVSYLAAVDALVDSVSDMDKQARTSLIVEVLADIEASILVSSQELEYTLRQQEHEGYKHEVSRELVRYVDIEDLD